ncbi:MAG: hypothetical protein HYX39_12190 [Bacteroidetes bacterium]|nr:hypothetical protein [Bacteroidota bacterium]
MTGKLLLFLTSFGAVFFTLSCAENKEADEFSHEDTLTLVQDTTKVTVSDSTKFKFDFALANIPSPANSMQELRKWNTPYLGNVLNDPKKAPNYTREFERAVNIGIYNIDMSYAIAHDKADDVLKYMKCIAGLTHALGLDGAVNKMVGKRTENNIGNKDSLFKILDDIFVKSDDYLRTNDRLFTAAVIFTGGWLESLYITCETGKEVDETVKPRVRTLLWEQRFHLGNIINLLNDYKDKKEGMQLYADLKPIHTEISAVKVGEMDEAEFNSISTKIIALRNKLTR